MTRIRYDKIQQHPLDQRYTQSRISVRVRGGGGEHLLYIPHYANGGGGGGNCLVMRDYGSGVRVGSWFNE